MHLLHSALLASHPKHFTNSWAQNIVDQHISGIKVTQIKITSIDIGTTTRTRFTIAHDADNTFPKCWFIKTPSLNWRARAITSLPRLLNKEIRFYNELAEFIPIDKPSVLYTKEFFGRGSTLVLNDLTEQQAITHKPGDSITVNQAMRVIKQLARMHAKFWNLVENDNQFAWLDGPVKRLEDNLGVLLATPLMKLGLAKAGDLIPNNLHQPAMNYARRRRAIMNFLAQGPQTIIHHDCHPGNIFWKESKAGLLDWQMVRIGEGISDIAYFLATSLEPEVFQTQQHRLLDYYIECLSYYGVIDIIPEQMRQRFRAHLIYPFEAMLMTCAVGNLMNLEDNLILIRRVTAAIETNDVFASLPI